MKRRNRIVAIVLCVFFVFFIFFAASFIAQEAEHECTGVECEICAQIENCQDTLKKLLLTVTAVAIAVAATFAAALKTIALVVELVRQATPLTLKVKLLN